MKKFKHFAYVGAIALVSVVGFTACSSSDDVALDPNPTFEGESVKTQFTISLPENIKMRMASATVQETGFRGIDNIMLVPYSAEITSSSTPNDDLFTLSAIDALMEKSNSKVYADVNLTVGTSHFLFYGKAIDNAAGTAISTVADKFKFGTLTVAGLTGKPTLSNVEFTPEAIYISATADGKKIGTDLITALNAVADAAPTDALSDGNTPKFKEVTAAQNATINALWTTLSKVETGSSKNIEWALKELYMNLDGLATSAAQSTVPDGYALATAIRTAIANYCNVTVSSGVTTAVTLKENLAGYPASVNLPDGAARIRYNATSQKFEQVTENVNSSGMNVASLSSYVYPANLQYFVNSSVKAANEVKSPGYADKTWTEILGTYTDGTAVTQNTRSVALNNQVQYGVARLDATVQGLSSEEGDKYYDHDGNEVDVTNGFTLTGILIGGQKSVGWDFTKKGTDSYTIYDKAMNTGATVVKKATASAINYTLVLQTGEENEDKTVNVALEFTNNCADFVGANGEIIPHGATFYLIGTLKTDAATNKDATAVAAAKDRVFTQDFKTIATFTIKKGEGNGTGGEDEEEGLGTATKGLPDLRTPIMELGLSVDLEWQPGLNFNVGI
jgi:hypothetical protein